MSVRLYPINVKTAEPIGSKVCAGPHITLRKVSVPSKQNQKYRKNDWNSFFENALSNEEKTAKFENDGQLLEQLVAEKRVRSVFTKQLNTSL